MLRIWSDKYIYEVHLKGRMASLSFQKRFFLFMVILVSALYGSISLLFAWNFDVRKLVEDFCEEDFVYAREMYQLAERVREVANIDVTTGNM